MEEAAAPHDGVVQDSLGTVQNREACTFNVSPPERDACNVKAKWWVAGAQNLFLQGAHGPSRY